MASSPGRISSLRTVGTFALGRACSDTLFHVLGRAYGEQMEKEEQAVMPLAGGIMQNGYQCGLIWGAALAAGARAYHLLGAGPRAEAGAIAAAGRALEAFRARNDAIDCFDITGTDKTSTPFQMTKYFVLKGGTIGCFRMAAAYAQVAYDAIEAALADRTGEVPAAPVSCAAELARRMGASDRHAVMAAGFAGGIGLSGGGCGALAAAIWVLGLKSLEGGTDKLGFRSPAALALIERFLKVTGYELECEKILGRRFEGVPDHAAHVREGRCAKVLDALAAG